MAAARHFLAARASIMTALTASCLLAAAARAGDVSMPEKISGGTNSSSSVPNNAGIAPEGADAIPDKGLDATILNSRAALTN